MPGGAAAWLPSDPDASAYNGSLSQEVKTVLKKTLLLLVVAFAAYSLIATPVQAAEAVRSAVDGLKAAANALIAFFDALTP